MSVSPLHVALAVIGVAAYVAAAYFSDRALAGRARTVLRYFVAGTTLAAYVILFWGLDLGPLHVRGLVGRALVGHALAVDITKVVIAVLAAFGVFYERHRVQLHRPLAERWKRVFGVSLALAAIWAYFGAGRFGYPKFYHRWDQYHYYMGAKYFREMGYDGLYRCTVIAQDELGTVRFDDAEHIGEGRLQLDMRAEVRHPDKKIRNLGGDNLIMPAAGFLERPEECKSRFSPERWEAYKRDVAFFRIASGKSHWEEMQKDHGYNPPPVWTIAGWAFASMFPPGHGITAPVLGHFVWLQALAMLDIAYGAAMFAALWWAFGWRVFVVSAILWGTQASAPSSWTQGAFLRQDWLFWLVFSACLARKRWFALSGAAMVYAGLLRVFPGLVVIGWLAVAGHHLYRHRTLSKPQWRMLGGGVLAAAILLPLSVKVAGPGSYRDFYRHTLEVHDRTPLTNHMGLRVLVSQKVPFGMPDLDIGVGPASGRMRYTKDGKLSDPFEVWKRLRNERYDRLRPVAWGLVGICLAAFAWAVRRIKSMWIAQCLAQVFIILMAQLTNYYYVFLILLAPLTRARPRLEVPIFGFAALSHFVFFSFNYNDDKYWMLTAVSLAFCLGTVGCFLPEADRKKISSLFPFPGKPDRGTS